MSNERTVSGVIENIYSKLRQDEILMRLLYYKPLGMSDKDPLDETLTKIVDLESDLYWEIVNERILLTEKLNDIEINPLARIYIVSGRARKDLMNKSINIQGVQIHIYTHDSYEYDLRNSRIFNRLMYLLNNKYFGGVGALEYDSGYPVPSPKEYTAYMHTFEYHINNHYFSGRDRW